MHDDSFQGFLEAVEQFRNGVFEGVQVVIWGPLFDTQQIAEVLNSDHNRLSL